MFKYLVKENGKIKVHPVTKEDIKMEFSNPVLKGDVINTVTSTYMVKGIEHDLLGPSYLNLEFLCDFKKVN